ncbi:ORC-CDC6 family AAA ATPase [Mucilaginibacter sp.]
MNLINNTFLKLSKRAETYDFDHLVKTFVDIGPLFTILSNRDHEILYGRRGTGKTHALAYLNNQKEQEGEIVINIDLRTIGSNGGIFSDSSIPVNQRATRLLIDTIAYIHDGIIDFVINDTSDYFDLSRISPISDTLADSISDIQVSGDVEISTSNEQSNKESDKTKTGAKVDLKNIGLNFDNEIFTEKSDKQGYSIKRQGREYNRVHFSSVYTHFAALSQELKKHVWIIFDEWSEVPLDIQPYLSELIRRTILPNRLITVKIAAIEQRADFALYYPDQSRIGIEVGADVAASQNLDEYMVFDNDEEKSKEFFSSLFYKHFINLIEPNDLNSLNINSPESLISQAFTQNNAFSEFVRATEGVPRDAINILGLAAMRAGNDKISMEDVRNAARSWYSRGKEKAISTNKKAHSLLRWIIDEVIGKRSARAFLLKTNIKDKLIDYLFDSRILHVIKENIAGKDEPGVRYNVYSIDYGCYVDLINTAKAPKGLFEVESDDDLNGVASYITVPQNDYRAIRRAILNLEDFYKTVNIE